jgi:integrase
MTESVRSEGGGSCDSRPRSSEGQVAPQVAPKRRVLPIGHLYRHPKTRGYYLRVRWPGEPRKVSIPLVPVGRATATKNRSVALAIARRLIAEREGSAPAAPGLDDILAAYRLSNSLRAKADTVNRNQSVLRVFLDAAGLPVHQVGVEHVEAYLGCLQAARRAPKTVKGHLTTIRSFFRWAVARGYADANPTETVELRPVPKRPPVSPPAESVAALLERAKGAPEKYRDDLILAIRIVADAGLRLDELIQLRRRALVDQGGQYALIVGERTPTKSGSWRVVPLAAETAEAILTRNLEPGDRIVRKVTPWMWMKRLKPLCDGLEGMRARRGTGSLWHALRSHAATVKARTYPPDGLIYRLMFEMGWRTPDMAQRYISIARAGGQ